MNFQKLKCWEHTPEEVLLASTIECGDVLQAKNAEIENLKMHDVFVEVENQGQPFINVTWVLTEKVKEGQNVMKARLVAKGFEERWKTGQRKDSPTCLRELASDYCFSCKSQLENLLFRYKECFLARETYYERTFLEASN